MDLSRLREAALRDGEDEEAVTVDTRALIDKVLARYSGEWTTLRELIQNAADARGTTVVIKWETHPSTKVPLPATSSRSEILKHIITHHTARRLLVKNDGQPFTRTDWGRLKRIAEGNPDETKIGAFGVGFYSVFADCEEPFVSSGDEAMAFYWKGNALFTRKIKMPEGQGGRDTTFMLDYRNTTTPIPNLLSICQFLATSLTFVALEKMEFWIDDYQILTLHKKASPPMQITIPKDLDTRTSEGLMTVSSVDRTSTQIDATFMHAIGWKPQQQSSNKSSDQYGGGAPDSSSIKSFFHRLTTSSAAQAAAREKKAMEEKLAREREALADNITATKSSTIFLRATSASVATRVSATFSAELERATKKPPPKSTKLSILTSSYDETIATADSQDKSALSKDADVFASVLPSKKPGGRIFIGFPTTQTTGAGMHISAPSVIPTVEREAIDLNARYVRTWNIEMLRCAGIMVRLAYTTEMVELSDKMKRAAKGARITPAEVIKFMPEAEHVLKTFTFADSTPSNNVGKLIEESFWTSYKQPTIEVVSTRGILMTSEVRIDNDELSNFVDGIPVIPKQLKEMPLINKMHDFGLISNINVEDIRKELDQKALTKDQLVNFISWASKKSLSGELDRPSRVALLQVAVATVGDDESSGSLVSLGTITNFLISNRIPHSMPIPPTTVPFEFTTKCKVNELQALGWEALEVVPWLKFLISDANTLKESQNLAKNATFAASVLVVLSKNWENMSISHRANVVTLLQSVTVMPTKMGMKKPSEAYFQHVRLFDDLPTLDSSCALLKEKFLTALGVRKTVELDTIFSRLLNKEGGGGSWSHVELIKYLASVRNDIPESDMRKLKDSKICPAEAGPKGAEPTKATTQLYCISELFEPKDSLRALELQCLQWPGPPGSFRPGSAEGKFLSALGLRPYPSVPELVAMMASSDPFKRGASMTYFIANHHLNGYGKFDLTWSDKAILPIEGNEKKLVTPRMCYTNVNAAILGFDILRKELHIHASKFGVSRDSPMTDCVKILLSKPPQDEMRARQLFEYFASRLADLGDSHLVRLRDAHIVPVFRETKVGSEKAPGSPISYIAPKHCYLGQSSTYSQIFDFVDFGQTANAFLFKCGAKSEPTKLEVAELACAEPARLLGVLQTPEKYLNLLRTLAEDLPTLRRDRTLWRKMRDSPFLLAFKETPKPPRLIETDEEDDDLPVRQYQLAPARDIVVPDDYISFRLFKDSLLCAPEEDALENFYLALGAHSLSSMVQEDLRVGQRYDKQDGATRKRKHILERTKLFLYEFAKYNRDTVKHDVKWLEKNVGVEVVRSLQLRRSLRTQSQHHTEKRYAASHPSGSQWVIYIAHGTQDDMYQLGQAICQLILRRPSQQAYLFFEPFLKLDLLQLRDRGYNVDRILRARAAEARIAGEERQKALELERQRQREMEAELAKTAGMAGGAAAGSALDAGASGAQKPIEAAARQEKRPETPPMPGSFGPESPEDAGSHHHKGKGLLNHISRGFGFKSSDDAHDQLSKLLGGSKDGAEDSPSGSGGKGRRRIEEEDDGNVTQSSVVHQNLQKAINSTRPHGSQSLFSPPHTQEVKEQATYCDSTSAKDIIHRADANNRVRVYVSSSIAPDEGMRYLRENSSAVNAFAAVLVEICKEVYGMDERNVHVFYDDRGGTIAFNSQGSVFCNLRFYAQLHAAAWGVAGDGGSGRGKAECMVYWFVVVAHELAHNIVKAHDAEHSYYTESFVQQYWFCLLDRMVALFGLPAISAATPAATPTQRNALPAPPLPPSRASLTQGMEGTPRSSISGPPPPYQPGPPGGQAGAGFGGDFYRG